jgi:[protein-PII] uridylyltransferase
LSLDTFRVLERSRRDAGEGRDEEIVRNLRYALRQRPLRLGPVKRSLSRSQRHFQIVPQIEFAAGTTADRTSMSLVCSDRPGLLALIAQVLRAQRVRVHGARIATFGERAEDFFVLSDELNQALDEPMHEAIALALRARLTEG